jgi:hypothetical protein
MPAHSEKQRRFFQAVKRAKKDPTYGNKSVRKVADSMTDKDIDDFASSIAELKMKKTLLGILKDSREPDYLHEVWIDSESKINPIAKQFHVKDHFEQYIKKYIGQPISPKEMEAINTFKDVKPSRVERTEIWYENTDEFKNSTTTVIRKMKDGLQFSFNAFQKHTSSQPEPEQQIGQEMPPGTDQSSTEPNTTPEPTEPDLSTEEEKDDIIVSKSPLFKDEIEGGAILVEFLKKLEL